MKKPKQIKQNEDVSSEGFLVNFIKNSEKETEVRSTEDCGT